MDEASQLAVAMVAKWSVAAQFGIVCILAVFFAVLARTVKLEEVRLWTAAWLADAVALGSVFAAAFLRSAVPLGRSWLVLYAGAKTAYALLLILGTRHHLEPGVDLPVPRKPLLAVLAVWSLALGFLSPRIGHAQTGQSLMVGGILCYGAVWVLRHPRQPRSRWIGWALLVQGLLFLHYVPMLFPLAWGGSTLAPYLSYSSFFDAGGELLVALAILVALEASSNEHLRHLNRELELSQERLRALVDLDPLTKLANRRGLRAELQRVQPQGAAIVFIDLDNFKSVNDRYGHAVGDVCLIRIATILGRHFRSEDALFRWGGDEFLVIAPGLDLETAQQRVEACRAEMSRHGEGAPPVAASAGIAILPPGGEPDAALREADQRMYGEKRRKAAPTPVTAT
jgi:diguanylate cyclase (GGDEF)-like protein